MLPAIGCPEDATLLLRPGQPAESAGKDVIWVVRINYDPADPASLVEAHVLPRLAGVNRLVNAIAHDIAVSNGPGFSSARPDHVRVRLGNCERPNSGNGLVIENGSKAVATVDGFPDSA